MKSLRILSLGVGTQSTTLYYMASIGAIERYDYAIFADPGRESKATYDYLRELIKWQKKNNGIPIIWTGKKSIYRDLINGTNSNGQCFASLPFFTKDENGIVGMLRRQCTGEYKIEEVNKAIRKLYGLAPRKRMPPTLIAKGITIDEIERLRVAQHKWQTFEYLFCGYTTDNKTHETINTPFRFTKGQCISWLRDNGFPVPPKSACTFCPFQSDARWLDMKRNDPKEWKAVVKLDNKIRYYTKKGVKQMIYLHRSCVPLDEVDFHEDQLDLFSSECYGDCGV